MKYTAATDGSNSKGERFGWGWVLTDENGVVLGTKYGSRLIDESWAHGHNVAAECTAVIDLLQSLKPECEIEIIHDYEGLGKWARGEWKAQKPCAVGYIDKLRRLNRKVTFTWVRGHSGHEMNELVDGLAKRGLVEQPVEPVFERRV